MRNGQGTAENPGEQGGNATKPVLTDKIVLNRLVGSTSTAVVGTGRETSVVSANHADGEVALYALTEQKGSECQ